jgi:hypothetical protein
MLLQHSSPVAAQSFDVWHVFGHAAYIGFRQRPEAPSDMSTLFTDVQHTSPMLVLQSVLVLHAFGHSLEGRQMPWL